MFKKCSFILFYWSSFYALWSGPSLSVKGEPSAIYTDGTTQTNITGDSTCLSGCTISGGTRIGDNLFHSFSELSILENTTVTFADGGAANIFARVSERASLVDGTLAVAGSTDANFFLINPHGIVFGPNAVLATAGSFVASTAESIIFADGAQFSATINTLPVLIVSAPIGLQFGSNPGSITNRSQIAQAGFSTGLQVSSGQTLSLVGSGVYLEGSSLTASSGQIAIGSVSAHSSVSLLSDLTVEYSDTSGFEDIYLTPRALIDASGNEGHIFIRGRNIVSEGAAIANITAANATAGSVTLVSDETIDFTGGGIFLSPAFGSASDGANLVISTSELALKGGAIISSGTFGAGNGGSLAIDASNSVELSGTGLSFPTLITSSTEGSGTGGQITIDTNRLAITDGAQIQAIAYSQGTGGDITIHADERVDIAGTEETASIGTSISGISAASGIEGLPFQPTGSGGSISITTDRLTISDRAQVSVNSLGQGNAGDLNVTARTVRLDNNAQVTATAAFGNGGNLYLEGLETLLLRRGSVISTQAGISDGQGDGGNIFINADFVVTRLLEDSDIVAKAAQGRGGNITIDTRGLYGIRQRRAIANNRTNDIDASSEFGISGTIEINQLAAAADLEGAILAERPLETATVVSKRCDATGNRFVVTGRGGVPASPNSSVEIHSFLDDLGESLEGDTVAIDSEETAFEETVSETIASVKDGHWAEATGWGTDANGQVTLFSARSQDSAVSHMAGHCTG